MTWLSFFHKLNMGERCSCQKRRSTLSGVSTQHANTRRKKRSVCTGKRTVGHTYWSKFTFYSLVFTIIATLYPQGFNTHGKKYALMVLDHQHLIWKSQSSSYPLSPGTSISKSLIWSPWLGSSLYVTWTAHLKHLLFVYATIQEKTNEG